MAQWTEKFTYMEAKEGHILPNFPSIIGGWSSDLNANWSQMLILKKN